MNAFLAHATRDSFPNTIINGPDSSLKRSLFRSFLSSRFGLSPSSPLPTTSQVVKVSTSASTTRDVLLYTCQYYTELNVSFLGLSDYAAMQTLIKRIASTHALSFPSSASAARRCALKIVVVSEADKMTHQAQQSLRRTLEACSHNCRFVFFTRRVDHLIAALRSRCLEVYVACRSAAEVRDALREKFPRAGRESDCADDDDDEQRVAALAENDSGLAENMMAQLTAQKGRKGLKSRGGKGKELRPDWMNRVDAMAEKIAGRSRPDLTHFRKEISDLLVSLVPAERALERLVMAVYEKVERKEGKSVVELGCKFAQRMTQARIPSMHLEAFVIQCIVALN